MPLKYVTGEDIRKDDRVRFHGEPGRVEFVAEASIDDPETAVREGVWQRSDDSGTKGRKDVHK
jgi:hypothetical protein